MGLSVHVYTNIEEYKREDDQDYDYDFIAFVIDEIWEYKIKNLKNKAYYSGDLEEVGISYPYSAHNRFREDLLRIVNREDLLKEKRSYYEGFIIWDKLDNNVPFYELIHFADNEGCLDWDIAQILYDNFKEFDLAAKQFLDEWDYENIYKKWYKIVKKAKDKGVIVFS